MTGEILWEPTGAPTAVGRYLEHLGRFDTYDELWRWSVDDISSFWASLWEWFDIGSTYATVVEGAMPEARWFTGARLNYAQRALAGDGLALIARSQSRGPVDWTFDELRDQVARCRAGLRRLGVETGDRVVGYLPNAPEAVVAFLAAASLGAIWASCPPEFGARSVIDRFGQLDPKVLIAVHGYRYGAKDIDRSAEVEAIRAALPTLTATVDVPYLGPPIPNATTWDDLLEDTEPLEFDLLPFDHPLYVLFSSGTTGLPKAIVHGHGGMLLEHLKALVLHHDLGPDDRFFWFSTTGWMMWNLLVSGLCTGAAIVLFDGDPAGEALWDLARETGTTFFGVSAPYLLNCRKTEIDTGAQPSIRAVGSTGAPLPAEGFLWVYDQLPEVWLTSVSGGTDVCTAFVGGSPLLPVHAGEISCRYLGAAVAAYDEKGQTVIGEQGELVITKAMPSMPVAFWGDPDGSAYRAAYFERFPGTWCHGDWITIAKNGTCTITGRSDATLNRAGVRLGTSEFYSVVEALPEVTDSLVVDLDGKLLLFVQLTPGCGLDNDLRRRLTAELRSSLSPRHAPDEIHAVRTIPRTHSGKKLEIPVKRILAGASAATVLSLGTLTDPTSIRDFEDLSRTRPTNR